MVRELIFVKVLFVLETVDINVSNTYRHIRQLITTLAKSKKLDIHVITIENNTYSQPIKNVKIIHLTRNRFPILDPINLLLNMNSLNKNKNFDLIYVHIISKLILPITLFKRLFNSKIIFWHAGIGLGLIPTWYQNLPSYIYKKLIYIPIIQNVDYFITGSHNLANEYQEKYKMPPNKFKIINNFVDVSEFSKNETENFKKDTLRFIYVGRLSKIKGTDILLSNFIKFANDIKRDSVSMINISLDIYGGDNNKIIYYKNYLSKLTDETFNNIRFRGKVLNKELPHILPKYDVFILPSRSEGFPRALIEAMSCGLCCIAPSKGAIPKIFSHNSGILFNPELKYDLFNKINFIFHNLDKIRYYGNNAIDRVQKNYSLSKISRKYEDLFFDIKNHFPK